MSFLPEKWMRAEQKKRLEKYNEREEAKLPKVAQSELNSAREMVAASTITAHLITTRTYSHPHALGFADCFGNTLHVERNFQTGEVEVRLETLGGVIRMVREDQIEKRPLSRWLADAAAFAAEADTLVKIEVASGGILVVAQSGDDYQTELVSWESLEASPTSPFPAIITKVERELAARDIVKRAEKMAAHG